MKRIRTVRQFADVMGALGGILEPSDCDIIVSMAWCLVPFDRRRAGVLAAAQPYRPRDLEMPSAAQCRVRPSSSRGARRRAK